MPGKNIHKYNRSSKNIHEDNLNWKAEKNYFLGIGRSLDKYK